MPPKMRLPSSYRPPRRSQRVRKVAAASSAPVTIVIDGNEDPPAAAEEVPIVAAEVNQILTDEAQDDDVPIASLRPSRIRRKGRGKKQKIVKNTETVQVSLMAENAGNTDTNDASALGEEFDDCEVFEDCDTEFRTSDEDDDNNRDNANVSEARDDFVRDEDNFDAVFGDVAREVDEQLSDEDSGDDIWDDGIIPDPVNSEDESEDEVAAPPRRHSRRPEDYLFLGKTFNCPEDFKNAILRYSLLTKYDIVLYRSQSCKIGAKCSDSEGKCQWRCYCSYDKKKQKMQIKVYVSEHSCVRSGYSKMLKQGTIAKLFEDRVRQNPKITPSEMAEEIKREYNLTVTENQCAKAKTKLFKDRKETHTEHFSRLWDYQAEIFRSNPGSIFDIETVPGQTIGSMPRFFRLFVCFQAQRDTWKNTCRPILGIDGAFLKWDIKGHLLAATGRDGDNRIVPVAWAIVEIENDDNWEWFMRKLAGTLDIGDGRSLAVISDKQAVMTLTEFSNLLSFLNF